jgi:hypothetical protein
LLKGPSNRASSELGLARAGSFGGESTNAFDGTLPTRDAEEANKTSSSFEYTGGRDDSTAGIILGGTGAVGSVRRGYATQSEKCNIESGKNTRPP